MFRPNQTVVRTDTNEELLIEKSIDDGSYMCRSKNPDRTGDRMVVPAKFLRGVASEQKSAGPGGGTTTKGASSTTSTATAAKKPAEASKAEAKS